MVRSSGGADSFLLLGGLLDVLITGTLGCLSFGLWGPLSTSSASANYTKHKVKKKKTT